MARPTGDRRRRRVPVLAFGRRVGGGGNCAAGTANPRGELLVLSERAGLPQHSVESRSVTRSFTDKELNVQLCSNDCLEACHQERRFVEGDAQWLVRSHPPWRSFIASYERGATTPPPLPFFLLAAVGKVSSLSLCHVRTHVFLSAYLSIYLFIHPYIFFCVFFVTKSPLSFPLCFSFSPSLSSVTRGVLCNTQELASFLLSSQVVRSKEKKGEQRRRKKEMERRRE